MGLKAKKPTKKERNKTRASKAEPKPGGGVKPKSPKKKPERTAEEMKTRRAEKDRIRHRNDKIYRDAILYSPESIAWNDRKRVANRAASAAKLRKAAQNPEISSLALAATPPHRLPSDFSDELAKRRKKSDLADEPIDYRLLHAEIAVDANVLHSAGLKSKGGNAKEFKRGKYKKDPMKQAEAKEAAKVKKNNSITS